LFQISQKFFPVLFMLLLISQGILAQQNRKSIQAYRLQEEETVKLDGQVNESFWEGVSVADGFRQREPVEGAPASERTEVRVAYDKDYLYIGVVLHDSEPEKIKAFQKRRDQSLATDDRFMFILDTYNDQRSAYFFEINPLGLMGDALIRVGQGSNVNKAWNGIWRAWVTKGNWGWSAEIRVPFRTLNFEPDNEKWGINFQRTIRRRNEELLWAGYRRNQSIFRPQDAGLLTGLSGMSQGLGLELNPYALVSQAGQRQPDGSISHEYQPNIGGELTYSITPNLRGAITVNTDFAETAVDDRQINLTRFPLFYPEQRDFFLEGSSVFVFAPSSGVNPYFSRRIGLFDGQPVPIIAGGRLIGRIGETDLGFLQVRTGAQENQPGEHFTVGRILQNISSESSVGLIYTRRDTDGEQLPAQQTIGTDIGLNTSEFMGNKNLQFQAFFISHTPNHLEDSSSYWDRSARGFRINFPNQPWSGHVSYREIGSAYDPAVGFVQRVGFRRLQPRITYSPLIEKSNLIREISFRYNLEYLMDLNFRPVTINHSLRILGLRLESGDSFYATLTHNYEYLNFPFDILRDERFIIPPGDYRNPGYRLSFFSASFRRVGINLRHSQRGFWTGKRTDYNLNLFLRPVRGLNISGSWIHSRVNLQEGTFHTHLFRLLSSYDFSPWVSLNMNIQYDNVSRLLGSNSRISWILRPGNILFLVYNHNWQQAEAQQQFLSLENRTNLKFSYTLRF
jgi:hypothetical protein